MTPDVAFAIRVVRQARGFSQRDLALKMGTTRQHVSAVERRQMVLSVKQVCRFAKALKVEEYVLVTLATAARRSEKQEVIP